MPPNVATNTPLPVAVGDVTVAVYVPLPLSVTEPMVPVPLCCVIVTVKPPEVSKFPLASFAVTVSTCVLVPFAVMLALVGVNVDCVALAAPGVYVTVDWVWLPVPLFTAAPPNVATKTPLPVAVGEVTVAVYVPLPLSVTEPILPVPLCLVIVTVEPPLVNKLPFTSFAVTVNTCVLLPSAVMLALVGVSVDCVALAAPGVYVMVDWVWLPVPFFTGLPPNVATNTPLPVAVGEVTVAV